MRPREHNTKGGGKKKKRDGKKAKKKGGGPEETPKSWKFKGRVELGRLEGPVRERG